MKRVHTKLLKKLTAEDIKQIRLFYRNGFTVQELAQKFNVSITTINWHLGELKNKSYVEVV